MDSPSDNAIDDVIGGPATPPTSADVARLAGVSRATVSYVLNGVSTQKISDKTRQTVLRAADDLGYRPNRAAQSLAAGSSRIVMFVIPSVHLGELSIAISSHLTARAAERGATLIVHFDGPGCRAVTDVSQDLRPRVIFTMFDLDADTTDWLQDRGVSVVSLLHGSGFAVPPNDRSGWLQVEHLTDRGHTAIGYADTADSGLEELAHMRRRGVADACRERGLAEPVYAQFELDGTDAQQKVTRWIDAGVTAVAAYNDEVAVAVLAGIRRAGLRCPEDLAVIGVDEMAINGAMEPPLSSIEFDVDKIARFYADALTHILDPQTTPGEVPPMSPTAGGADDYMHVVERASTVGAPRQSD